MKELSCIEINNISGGGVNFFNYGTVIKGINTVKEAIKTFPEPLDNSTIFTPKPHWNSSIGYWHGGF
ncbi:hypothetical protein AH845_005098 [Salmonella enterica subsp. enterica]|nr:hypothetical protein [Salmonella enterica]ECD7340229.1 hypothetical protein [Salmonella enterica subsp. enterica serovar Newport]EEA8681735.1 hypothetical protein [Salmonella enterica subsp. enterica]EHE7853699.1 hypothetical protein [Salmonella enterica subsp. enterica serovar Teko]